MQRNVFKSSEKKMEFDKGVQLIDHDNQNRVAAEQLKQAKKLA